MKISEIMHKGLEFIEADQTLSEAAQLMESKDIGVLPVKQGNQITGIITDRDIVVRGLSQSMDPQSTKISEIMTPNVVCCSQDEDLEQAASLMEQRQIHRLLVLDDSNQPVGIVATSDFALRCPEEHLVYEVVEKISEPGHSSW